MSRPRSRSERRDEQSHTAFGHTGRGLDHLNLHRDRHGTIGNAPDISTRIRNVNLQAWPPTGRLWELKFTG